MLHDVDADSTFLLQVHGYEDEVPLSEAGTLSSHASSVDLASEDLTDMIEKVTDQADTNVMGHRKTIGNGENIVLPADSLPDRQETVAVQLSSDLAGKDNQSCATSTPATISKLEIPQISDEYLNLLNSTSSSTFVVTDRQAYTTRCVEMDKLNDSVFHNQNQAPGIIRNKQEADQGYTETESAGKLSSIATIPSEESSISDALSSGFSPTASEEASDLSMGGNSVTEHQQLTEPLSNTLQMESETQEAHFSQEMVEREGSVSSETTASVMTAIHVPDRGNRDQQPILKSSSESLRQISLQLSGLMLGSEGTGKK